MIRFWSKNHEIIKISSNLISRFSFLLECRETRKPWVCFQDQLSSWLISNRLSIQYFRSFWSTRFGISRIRPYVWLVCLKIVCHYRRLREAARFPLADELLGLYDRRAAWRPWKEPSSFGLCWFGCSLPSILSGPYSAGRSKNYSNAPKITTQTQQTFSWSLTSL